MQSIKNKWDEKLEISEALIAKIFAKVLLQMKMSRGGMSLFDSTYVYATDRDNLSECEFYNNNTAKSRNLSQPLFLLF